jgi:hypothetical protein
MNVAETAEAIRRIHGICQKWEDDVPIGDCVSRPQWTRWFRTLYVVFAWVSAFGIIELCLQLHLENRFLLQLFIWGLKPLIWILIGYGAVSCAIDGYYAYRELREFSHPFSSDEAKELEASLSFDAQIACEDPVLVGRMARRLEDRAKQIETIRVYLLGIASLGFGAFGVLLWNGGPAKAFLKEHASSWVFVTIQVFAFAAVIGAVIGLAAAWRKGIACTSRALRLRRILEEREHLLAMTETLD